MSLSTDINHRYGTWRGLVRLWLAWAELVSGRLRTCQRLDLARVNRLVWVCQGNVCRSPYADKIAAELGLPTASFGLSTTTGAPAYGDAIAAAARANRDLGAHRATDLNDFDLRDGDLLVAMEVRQIRQLEQRLPEHPAQRTLLGLWARPRRPHIHDPMTLSASYFDTCYAVTESGVRGLGLAWRQAVPVQRRSGLVAATERSEKNGAGSPASKT